MTNWTVKQVIHWLKENDFKKQVKIFREKSIDGNALMRLTNEDLSQLFSEMNEDGTIQEATIGVKSRFRTKLNEWKMNHQQDETVNDAEISDRKDKENALPMVQDEHLLSEKTKTKESSNLQREYPYQIDDGIQLGFFQKEIFSSYFLHYIKQEICSIEINIDKVKSEYEDSLVSCTIKLTGTKKQIRLVRNLIKDLLKSIQLKNYNSQNLQHWSIKNKSTDIIQNILNNQTKLFTVCQSNSQSLQVYYFNDEKFNSSQDLIIIDHVIQNEITQETILWSSIDHQHRIELINSKTQQICITEQFSQEFQNLLNRYNENVSLIFISDTSRYLRSRGEIKRSIEIFGYRKLVDELLQQFKDLFNQHRLQKFRLGHISSTELDFLMNFCSKELRSIEQEFHSSSVEFHIQENHFYGPQCLKDQIRNSIKNILSKTKIRTFKNIDLYCNTADIICSTMKILARKTASYCNIKLKTKLRSYSIPRSQEHNFTTSKSIIEQSDLFSSSPLVFCQTKLANGSLEVLIGDIASQKVDILIIPRTIFGLKESLIERAGELIEEQIVDQNNSIPFITETTGGKLNCQKILFVNWSLPTTVTNDDDLSESVRLFISKSIQYVLNDSQQSNLKTRSIAFAAPDSSEHEEILAEEMIEETINQINATKSLALKVSFILLSDQQTLHKHFSNTIQNVQRGDEHFGIFYCPTTTVIITLMSFDDDCLEKCETKLTNYLQRSIFKIKLDGFKHWNQPMINAFYKYSIDRCVLPKSDDQQLITLYGPVNNVNEVHQKYQLTNLFIQQKLYIPSINGYHIMISYSPEDSIISHRLATRLIDEDFSVSINANSSLDLERIQKSDCVILCTSENYFQNSSCQQEAISADEMGKPLIPVKVKYYQPIGWLKTFFNRDSYFQLFGSENHFNFEYEKLLLKIFQYMNDQTSSALIKSIQGNVGLYFLLTPEQKKLKYEKNVKKLLKLEKGKISENDRKDLVKNFQDILQRKETQCQQSTSEKNEDYVQHRRFISGIVSYKQWLEKLENLKTKLNIAPFTFTGDINDAPFPLLDQVKQNPSLLYSLCYHETIPIDSKSSSEDGSTPPVRRSFKPTGRISTAKQTNSRRSSIVSQRSTKPEENISKRNSVISRTSNRSVQRSERAKERKIQRRILPKNLQ